MISDNFLLALVWRRMKEMGYQKYHIETEVIQLSGAGNIREINAYNQFYYLVSKNIPDNTVVKSDSNYYKTQSHNELELYGIQEFSGAITLIRGDLDTRLEFLVVTIER
jgi:hypothetical protein